MLQLDPDDPDEDENKVLTALSGAVANAVMNPATMGAATSVLTEADQVALANYKVLCYVDLMWWGLKKVIGGGFKVCA